MCIFCERAKASLDDPFAGLGLDASYDAHSSSAKASNSNRARGQQWEATLHQKREAERCEELRRRARLPITVITGFLGAGKTTFVNHVLSARHGRRLAVIENEFGEVAVDDELLGDGGVERAEEAQQVILMPNGCMCCRVRGDLVAALKRLIVGAVDVTTLEQADESPAEVVDDRDGASTANPAQINNDQGQRDVVVTGQTPPASVQEAIKPDGVIIECSGLDELAPVLQTFFADPFVQEHMRLDAVVCLCDSPRLLRTLIPSSASGENATTGESSSSSTSSEQVAGIEDASAVLVMSQLALSDRILLNKSDLVTSDEGESLVKAVEDRFPGTSVTLCVRGGVDIDLVLGVESFSLDKALEMDRHFADMLTDADRTGVPQHHHDHDHATEQHPNGNPHDGRGVHGKGDTTKSWPHGHDRLGARSVGIELTDGPIDWVKFKEWLKGFLEGEQERIWRLKGVLWTSARGSGASGYGTTTAWGWGAGSRAVVQGLYGHFESEVGDWPAGSTRRSRLVFIGDLPPTVQETLKAGVRSCIAQPRPRPPPPPLRKSTVSSGGGAPEAGFANRFGTVKFGDRDDSLLL